VTLIILKMAVVGRDMYVECHTFTEYSLFLCSFWRKYWELSWG